MKTPKPRKKPAPIDPGVKMLRDILAAMSAGMRRGGLTFLAGKLGMSPSNTRKRMVSTTGGFDGPTLRAALLVLASKPERFTTIPVASIPVGQFIIDLHQTEDGAITPAWRVK